MTQVQSAPKQYAQIDPEENVREKWAARTYMCSDRAAKISREQYRPEYRRARNSIKQCAREQEDPQSECEVRRRRVTEIAGGLQNDRETGELHACVHEHEQHDERGERNPQATRPFVRQFEYCWRIHVTSPILAPMVSGGELAMGFGVGGRSFLAGLKFEMQYMSFSLCCLMSQGRSRMMGPDTGISVFFAAASMRQAIEVAANMSRFGGRSGECNGAVEGAARFGRAAELLTQGATHTVKVEIAIKR